MLDTHATMHIWRSEDNLREPVLIFYHVVPKVLTQVNRHGGRSLCLLNQLAGPWVFLKLVSLLFSYMSVEMFLQV